jgi:hypothetical protein
VRHTGVSNKRVYSAHKAGQPRERVPQPIPRPATHENRDGPESGVESNLHVLSGGHFTPGCYVTPARSGSWE